MPNKFSKEYNILKHHGWSEFLLPIKPSSKIPAVSNWNEIDLSAFDWTKHLNSSGGIGIRLGETLVALDIDCDDEEITKAIDYELKRVLGVNIIKRIGRNPRSLYLFKAKHLFKKKVCEFYNQDGVSQKVEILGNGQQIVAYGIHPNTNKAYEWVGGDLCDGHTPHSLIVIDHEIMSSILDTIENLFKKEGYRKLPKSNSDNDAQATRYPIPHQSTMAINKDEICDALEHIRNDLSYDDWIRLTAAFKAAVGGDEEYFHVYENWSLQYPENTPDIIRSKWDSIMETSSGAGTIIYEAQKRGWIRRIPNEIIELNKRFFLLKRDKDIKICEELKHKLNYYTKQDFLTLLENMPPVQINDSKTMPLAKYWLQSPYRREYNGETFDPNNTFDPEIYNHWKGYVLNNSDKAPSSWEKFSEFILNIICSGNNEHYNYILDWIAHGLQKPHEKPGVAVVLIGEQGAGKSFFASRIGELFLPYAQNISRAESLTGRFSIDFSKTILCVVDEAILSKSQESVDRLKALITENRIDSERKFKETKTESNYTRFIFTSNNEDVVETTHDARRFFMPDIANSKSGKVQYFEALLNEWNNGGKEAMFFDLKNRDITNVDPRHLPFSENLFERKLKSTNTCVRWVVYCLRENKWAYNQERTISKDTLYSYYSNYWYAQTATYEFSLARETFFKTLKRIFGDAYNETRPNRDDKRDRCVSLPLSHDAWSYIGKYFRMPDDFAIRQL